MLHVDEPLQRQARLNGNMCALRETHLVGVVFHLLHQSGSLEVDGYLLAHVEAVHAHIQRRLLRHCAVGVEDVDGVKVMGLAQHIVVHVVSRSNLQAASTELNIDVSVFNHIYHAANQRHNHLLALEPLVLGVFGVDAHGGVAHDGFGTSGGNHSITAALSVAVNHFALGTGFAAHVVVGNVVAQIVELRFFFFVIHLVVAQGSLVLRVPVNHAQAAINQALVVEVAEHLQHALAALLVHSERRAAPVARSAKLLQLLQDDATMLVSPVPCMFKKLFASEVGLFYALGGKLVHHLSLGGNAGMVGARHPKGILALHACTANENILNGVVEHVAHVKHAGYVRRRNHNGVRFALVGSGLKQIVVHPIFIPFILHFGRIVFGSQFVHIQSYLYYCSIIYNSIFINQAHATPPRHASGSIAPPHAPPQAATSAGFGLQNYKILCANQAHSSKIRAS